MSSDEDVERSRPVRPVTAVRSTLLLSSLDGIRKAGHQARYEGALEPEYRPLILDAIAGVWLPVHVGLAHYRACDALELTPDEQMTLGRHTGDGLKRHLTRWAGILSRGVGIKPDMILAQFPRFWSRSFEGGAIQVRRLGPKDVDLAYVACALLQSPYFRSALRGVAVGLLEGATRRVMMHEKVGTYTPDRATYRVCWV